MKYKHNGVWKEIKIKPVDTVPVGSIFEYDGEDIPDGYEQVYRKNIITVSLTEEISMTTDSQYTEIGLDTIISQAGNKLQLAETVGSHPGVVGVKIGKGVSKVLISGKGHFTNDNASSNMYFNTYIYKEPLNDTSVLVARVTSPTIAPSTHTSGVIPPMLIDVEEGDILYLRAYKSILTGKATIGLGQRTYMTVEVVE